MNLIKQLEFYTSRLSYTVFGTDSKEQKRHLNEVELFEISMCVRYKLLLCKLQLIFTIKQTIVDAKSSITYFF